MKKKKVKGIKIFKIDVEKPNSSEMKKASSTYRYSSSFTKNEIIYKLIGIVSKFSKTRSFPWHLQLQIETRFDFHNLEMIKKELDLQEKLAIDVTHFLRVNCDLVKVISYLQNSYYHYHWYMRSNVLAFDKFETWFENIMFANEREIKFAISKDPSWQNVTSGLFQESRVLYSLTVHLSENEEKLL